MHIKMQFSIRQWLSKLLELANKTNLVCLAFNASFLSLNYIENIAIYFDALESKVAILPFELIVL